MATKTMRVELEITVSDLSAEQRAAFAEYDGVEASEMPSLDDAKIDDVADVLLGIGEEDLSAAFFDGSEVYAKFTGVRVLSAKWGAASRTRRAA